MNYMKKIKKLLIFVICVILLLINMTGENNIMILNAISSSASAGFYPYRVIYNLKDGGFEDGGFEDGSFESNWSFKGNVSVSDEKSYYGKNSLKLINSNNTSASIWQTVNTGDGDEPKAGKAVEAGVWLYIDGGANMTGKYFTVLAEGFDINGNKITLAQSQPLSSDTPKNQWLWIKASSVKENETENTISEAMTYIQVAVDTNIEGTVYIDFVQAGEINALNGNPKKMAFFAYQPWYGNPVDNGDARWYNWAWSGGPSGMNHDPYDILPNGQRDVASMLYPIAGAYSSVDEDTLRYQMEISKAAHIDGFMINDYGKEINPNYRKCVEMMLDLAEEYDMKIALQYDAKIHFANWVPSTSGKTRGEQIQGIIDDLEYIIKNYAPKKSYLKFNGIHVINPFGTNLLSDKEWGEVKQKIEADGYGRFFLMADRAPKGKTYNIDAAYNWISLDDKMNPESKPSYPEIFSWAVSHNKKTYDWVKGNFANRFGIGCAWPGFNDEGVGGNWGSGTARRFAYNTNDVQWWTGPADPNGDTLDAIQYSNLESGVDWILYATFNDWNEATSLEPSVEFGYRYIKEIQRFLEVFKEIGKPSDENLMQKITEDYLAGRLTEKKPESTTLIERDKTTSAGEFVVTEPESVTAAEGSEKPVISNNAITAVIAAALAVLASGIVIFFVKRKKTKL